jgi:hypothetical protein
MHKNAEQTEDLLNELIDKIPLKQSTNNCCSDVY